MTPLKLVAFDDQDLAILSAHCQDAVVKVADIDYAPGRQHFTLAVNRFAWEAAAGWFRHHHERRRSVIHFARVNGVRITGIDQAKKDEVLALLALRWTAGDNPSGVIEMVFSGSASIRLEVECIEASLSDLGGAWETASRPAHQV